MKWKAHVMSHHGAHFRLERPKSIETDALCALYDALGWSAYTKDPEKLAAAVESAIRAAPGVTGIETVCHKSGRAIVVFDPVRTSPRKIAAAINATPCKVVIP